LKQKKKHIKENKSQLGSFKESKASDFKNTQTSYLNKFELATDRNKTYSFFRERNKSKNESDNSSCRDLNLILFRLLR